MNYQYSVVEHDYDRPLRDQNPRYPTLAKAKDEARAMFAKRKLKPKGYNVAVVDLDSGHCYLVVRKSK
jgi:hypothetical protein